MASSATKSRRETEELARELTKRVSGEVRFDQASRVLYSTDASIYQMMPVGVVVPRNVDDVLAVVDLAKRERVPLLPRGGGTSLSGQAVNHGIVMDFSKYMSSVLEVDAEEGWARVQPGIVLESLNRQLSDHRLHFAPDPTTANRSTIGGAIGNNSCGAHSILYGKTLDQVMELQVILSDGSQSHLRTLSPEELEARMAGDNFESEVHREALRIARENSAEIEARYPRIMRRVSGYNLDEYTGGRPFNLARLIVGSEGTLCTITEAKVKLEPVPRCTGTSVLHFKDIFEACDAAPAVLEHGPAAVEFVDDMVLRLARSSLAVSRNMTFVEGDPGAMLLVEHFGDTEAEVAGKMEAFRTDMLGRGLGYACVNLSDGGAQAKAWSVRKAGLGLLMSVTGDAKPIPFVEDTAVDPEKLGDFVRRFDEIVKAHSTEAGYYGHASVGCLHIRPLINLKTRQGIDGMLSIAEEVADLVLEFGGSLSGEHGDGIVRGVWTSKMFGPKLYDAFVELKNAFDPQGIMNPGKIVQCPPMDENLRYGASYKARHVTASLDFSKFGSYAGAVEMCNGMGACRKADGTMCPSYQVTKEEEHSTRGRANLLRAVLSGTMSKDGLASRRLHDALDLCLECKGCKGECPSLVDMAKLKYEFLDNYNSAHGIPLRSRLFANINRLNRLGCALSPISNWLSKAPGARGLLHSLLRVHKDRPLPSFAKQTFPAWFRSHRPLGDGAKGEVVLFNDTFMNFNTPEVGIAAVELLEQAGYRVVLANAGCCGRPMISKGMLARAKNQAERNVDRLYPWASQGTLIIGCEPSCLLTLRDEYPDLLRNEKSKVVAEQSLLIDEFLVRCQEQGNLGLTFSGDSRSVLFHGHCHQKALLGTGASIKALSMPPGHSVELVNAGCCGMAGAFGYEKEHYDLSMAIGEDRLFPAVRGKGAEWEVAVTGISCRQQIEHGTGRRARHLVEVLRDAVKTSA